ncbi:Der GTPase-activating protein YihI [Aliiglaciecola litoralis]|uniref:Der GTPase-activating protein YihI n=1 Tax=Aliiglaciecola litoralis TaxID=582857 RepID=A0ABP3X4R7_9ALTE
MARVKKSRKIGQIGVPKESWAPKKPRQSQAGKPKKHKGNVSGTRNSVVKADAQNSGQRQNNDPRIGSKKPIPLLVKEKSDSVEVKKAKFFSPAQELKAIEDDERLATLLDQLDEDKSISKEDQAYVDATLARHKILCGLLGIGEEDEEQQTAPDEDDPFARFESIDINKFK